MLAVPLVTPCTTPVEDIVATSVFEEVHVPPVTDADKLLILPAHTVLLPDIRPADGSGLTVTVFIAVAVLQAFVTV